MTQPAGHGPGAYPRLTHPLVRDSRDEEFRRAGWDEALDRVARGLRRHRGAFGMLSGARATNETNYLAQKFARVVMGTHNVDSCDRRSHAASVAGLAAVFGAGGGTSSYAEIEHTDVVVVWGSNARVTHPVFFQHVLKGVRAGARMYVVDPRRTSTAQWADGWLGLNAGTDIALAHAIGREIIRAGLVDEAFVGRATSGFEEYRALVEPWTLSLAQKVTGVPAAAVRELAHAYARADRAQICWTLGVTEHRNGTDTVRALIDLALLTGHVGRPGSGLQPLCGRNNVQGAADMGAVPHRLPGFQDVLDPAVRRRFESAWDTVLPPHHGLDLAEMSEEMEAGGVRAVHCVGADPARSGGARAVRRLRALDFLVVQDAFRTSTAELADVVLPATAGPAESEGTVTSSERRVQRVRRAVVPPGEARGDVDILCDLAGRLGHAWRYADAEAVWNELRSLSPDHHGMTYRRLAEHRGLQWPCPGTDGLEPPYLHGRLWADEPASRGRRAPFGLVPHVPPADLTDERFPIRLTTGRRLDSYNAGAARGSSTSPARRGECVELCPEDAERYGVVVGEKVQITSRRGAVVAPVWIDTALRPGLAFTTLPVPDEADVDQPLSTARCPIRGAAEYKATAIRIDKLPLVTCVG
ncbi:formate dehydrogenase [Streptomyces sp. Act143]|uniref:molybdopterin oxidoreductase family protein n=1 Tax=Streptomyces sp. Act143 TaxID=2200760 RepID=UPI000D6809B9|nr:molybdopterin-dependent oxidoreductase [Streptomyces sp. Act143]PWI14264.1 formate dehydrogenase [Streptomyces sp. Act143]